MLQTANPAPPAQPGKDCRNQRRCGTRYVTVAAVELPLAPPDSQFANSPPLPESAVIESHRMGEPQTCQLFLHFSKSLITNVLKNASVYLLFLDLAQLMLMIPKWCFLPARFLSSRMPRTGHRECAVTRQDDSRWCDISLPRNSQGCTPGFFGGCAAAR